jgi:regulator of protease activity HflC (stomatin/prohibitin superfamily)
VVSRSIRLEGHEDVLVSGADRDAMYNIYLQGMREGRAYRADAEAEAEAQVEAEAEAEARVEVEI